VQIIWIIIKDDGRGKEEIIRDIEGNEAVMLRGDSISM